MSTTTKRELGVRATKILKGIVSLSLLLSLVPLRPIVAYSAPDDATAEQLNAEALPADNSEENNASVEDQGKQESSEGTDTGASNEGTTAEESSQTGGSNATAGEEPSGDDGSQGQANDSQNGDSQNGTGEEPPTEGSPGEPVEPENKAPEIVVDRISIDTNDGTEHILGNVQSQEEIGSASELEISQEKQILRVKVTTDQERNLNLKEEVSYVKTTYTPFNPDAESETMRIAFTQQDNPSEYQADVELKQGTTVVEVVAEDDGGLVSEKWTRTFVYDVESPKLSKVGEVVGEKTSKENVYRNATVEVEIEDDQEMIDLRADAYIEGQERPLTITSEWETYTDPESKKEKARGTLHFTEAGTYTKVVVWGKDIFYNEMAGIAEGEENVVNCDLTIDPAPHVNEKSISIDEENAGKGEEVIQNNTKTCYYRDEVKVQVRVPDLDLDGTRSYGENSETNTKRETEWIWDDAIGSWIGSFSLLPGVHKSIKAVIADSYGIVTIENDRDDVDRTKDRIIVVDQVAPTVKEVTIDKSPVNECNKNAQADGELMVYDSQTTIKLSLEDNERLRLVEVYPAPSEALNYQFAYELKDPDRKTGTATLVIANDGDAIDRSVILKVIDSAGNYCLWSIDTDGAVRNGMGEEVPVANTKIDTITGNPWMFVVDKEKPVVALSMKGTEVVSGARKLRLDVTERNLERLRIFDASQKVLKVSRWNEKDVKKDDYCVVALDSTDPIIAPVLPQDMESYFAELEFVEEGDYEAVATINDIAGNAAEEQTYKFSIDNTAPTIKLTGFEDNEFTNDETRAVTVEVTERHFVETPSAQADAPGTTVSISYTSPDKKTTWDYELNQYEAGEWTSVGVGNDKVNKREFSLSNEGRYTITVEAVDEAGNKGESVTKTITVDRTAPLMSVKWTNDASSDPHNKNYYQGTRTAVVSVVEANWNDDAINDGFVDLEVVGLRRSTGPVVKSSWELDGTGERGLDKYTATLDYTVDAQYPELIITGTDLAGNKATIDWEADEPQALVLKSFTLDQEDPFATKNTPFVKMTSASEGVVKDGVTYYNHTAKATVRVTDRNLDASKSSISYKNSNSAKTSSTALLKKVSTTDDFETTWESVVSYGEGKYTEPSLYAIDYAERVTKSDSKKTFVVDLTAPTITSVTLDQQPSFVGGKDDMVHEFFQQPTSMTIKIADNFMIDTAQAKIVDPQKNYSRDAGAFSFSTNKKSGTITINLDDGAQAAYDTEFDRYENSTIVLTVKDAAGNVRTWSIDRNGTVTDDKGSNPKNTTINGEDLNPLALIHDRTPPRVSLSGVTAGQYYNANQTVTAAIDEFNFGYLKEYDRTRGVMHISMRPASAGAGMVSVADVPVEAFAGSGSNWVGQKLFDSDGHYVVWVDFYDIANNRSETPRIGEFTIDKTAPAISIQWDNNDMHNGKYYKATRTATITVYEHNFSSSLFNVSTNGIVSGWSSNGDTHTCVVSFGEGGPYNLSVNGKDLAGNEATPVSEPEFIIDLTAPEIRFAGVGERIGITANNASTQDATTFKNGEAYNGVVAPTITYSDDNNFDMPAHYNFELAGGRGTKLTASDYTYDSIISFNTSGYSNNSLTLSFDDFGAKTDDAGNTVYDVNADDIYTIHATMSDLADNTAEADVIFSVNRYGSNYIVKVLDEDTDTEYTEDDEMLPAAPMVEVREINVSGVDAGLESHEVTKEYANVTTVIDQDAENASNTGKGYQLVVTDNTDDDSDNDALNSYGWAEYVYKIRSDNFGSSVNEERETGVGQGLYRVNVLSNDTASNGNSTAEYWTSSTARTKVDVKEGTAEFTLDQQGPVIDSVDLPESFAVGAYKASFHVTDVLTSTTNPNKLSIMVDGTELTEDEYETDGNGTYSFEVPTQSFAFRNMQISVTDYAGRSDSVDIDGAYVTSLIPEGLILAGTALAAGGITHIVRRRKETAEPDVPVTR